MNKPMRPCRYPGCGRLVASGYCDRHKPKPVERSAEASEWHVLYSLPQWKQLRERQLLRSPFCRECSKVGIRRRATDVDHVKPHCGDLTLFLDESNLQSLCHSCHSRKTAAEMAQKSKNKSR